ncbi:hypothetical protein N8907_01130, partial [bacterium]|nr:hypothetical protein [bacterium]
LIEDCALSGFSTDVAKIQFGDICIYSLWKFHALPDGAILKIRKQSHSMSAITYQPPRLVNTLLRRLKIEIKKWTMRGVLPFKYLTLVRGEPQDPPSLNEECEELSPMTSINKISQVSFQRFLAEDLEGIATQRRYNFNALTAYCHSKNIRTLYDQIAENDIPYCCPIIVDNPLLVKRKLADAGIESEISVNAPSSFSSLIGNSENCSHIEQLSLKCISLPIHQNVDAAMLDYLMSKLSSVITLTDGDTN